MSKKRKYRSPGFLSDKGSKIESPRQSQHKKSPVDQPFPHGYMDDMWLEEEYFWAQRKEGHPQAGPPSGPPREWDPWMMEEWMLERPPNDKEAPWAKTDAPMVRPFDPEHFAHPPFPRDPSGKGEVDGNKDGEPFMPGRFQRPVKERERMPEAFDETAGLHSLRRSSRKSGKGRYRK
ncbi:hypothetical protein [Lihuaxuella thermophila]|uniref:Uncharacterized protein n=1 Tax=Lihuaxuella thermophila TaxID=1173111 RepID=A0A1H8E898_9BACL|nr:hypothetical protein [Lihuaxuella thermophila]SEN15682.1 hypothetical protein SAMN05444955_106185 [Lihuaxuella thermophila]